MGAYSECLNQGLFVATVACQDCLLEHANGQVDSDSRTAEQIDHARQVAADYDITTGHVHTGPYAEQSCFHAGEECPDSQDCDCERTDFSGTECGMCGTRLAGYRNDMIFIARTDLNQRP